MKTYRGFRNDKGETIVRVYIKKENGSLEMRHLKLRLDLANKSPTGFNWGYGGSGPAQLALALLADALGNDRRAMQLYQTYKWRVIGALPDEWELTEQQVRNVALSIPKNNSWFDEDQP